ncbi:MAG: winged helix DNA-binding domain-containing protein [Thermoplasmata archaeon]
MGGNETKDDSAIELSAAEIAAFRLRHHHLLRRAPRDQVPLVARDVGGIQAQVESAAKASLRARVAGLILEDVDRALWEDRTLVKLWVMRGTVHLVSTEDLASYLAGLRREGLFREQQWMRRYGLREEDFREMPRAAEEALASGPLTRRELGEAVVERLGERARKWVEHGYGGVIRLATIEGKVCFGPNRGKEITFVLLDDWLGPQPGGRPEEAETELLRRYLHAYGPATPQDFAAWSGMRMGIVREIWERAKDELQTVIVDGGEAQILARDVDEMREEDEEGASVRLLPYFDVYLLGHKGKEHLVDPAHYKRVYRKAGWISQVVLVNGRVAGIWTQKARATRLTVTVEAFEPLDGVVRQAVEEEAADLGRFLGEEAEVVFAP